MMQWNDNARKMPDTKAPLVHTFLKKNERMLHTLYIMYVLVCIHACNILERDDTHTCA